LIFVGTFYPNFYLSVFLFSRKPSGGNRSVIGVNCRDEKGRTPLHISALTGMFFI